MRPAPHTAVPRAEACVQASGSGDRVRVPRGSKAAGALETGGGTFCLERRPEELGNRAELTGRPGGSPRLSDPGPRVRMMGREDKTLGSEKKMVFTTFFFFWLSRLTCSLTYISLNHD